MVSARKSILSAVPSQAVVRSHVESNRDLAKAFERYLISRRVFRTDAPSVYGFRQPLRRDVAFNKRGLTPSAGRFEISTGFSSASSAQWRPRTAPCIRKGDTKRYSGVRDQFFFA